MRRGYLDTRDLRIPRKNVIHLGGGKGLEQPVIPGWAAGITHKHLAGKRG